MPRAWCSTARVCMVLYGTCVQLCMVLCCTCVHGALRYVCAWCSMVHVCMVLYGTCVHGALRHVCAWCSTARVCICVLFFARAFLSVGPFFRLVSEHLHTLPPHPRGAPSCRCGLAMHKTLNPKTHSPPLQVWHLDARYGNEGRGKSRPGPHWGPARPCPGVPGVPALPWGGVCGRRAFHPPNLWELD